MTPLFALGGAVLIILVPILEWCRRREAAADEAMTPADWQRVASLPLIVDRQHRQPVLDQRFTGTQLVDRRALKAILKPARRRKPSAKPRRLQVVPIDRQRRA